MGLQPTACSLQPDARRQGRDAQPLSQVRFDQGFVALCAMFQLLVVLMSLHKTGGNLLASQAPIAGCLLVASCMAMSRWPHIYLKYQ